MAGLSTAALSCGSTSQTLINRSLVLLDSLRGSILSLCLGSGDAGCSGAHLPCFGVSTCFGDSNPSILAGLPASFTFCMRCNCEVLTHGKHARALWRLRMPQGLPKCQDPVPLSTFLSICSTPHKFYDLARCCG